MGEVYKAIGEIQGKLARTGIAKEGTNSAQNYKFRGIDQVYAALSPLLAEHGLCVLPRMVEHHREERVSMKPGYNGGPAKESVLFYVTVAAEFDFVAVSDGSTHTVRTYGEAMDSGDKATNKAMSAAYKYAAFMAFAIPTEGDNDADATTHEVVPQAKRLPAEMPSKLRGGLQALAAKLASAGDVSELDDTWNSPSTTELLGEAEKHPIAKQWLHGGEAVEQYGDSFVPLYERHSRLRTAMLAQEVQSPFAGG